MKIFNSHQTHFLDKTTIEEEPITSLDLMERASSAFVSIFEKYFGAENSVYVFCGTGNNGGDGLAIARMLHQKGYDIHVFILGKENIGTVEFLTNLERLNAQHCHTYINQVSDIVLKPNGVIIDALLGSGINRPAEGFMRQVIHTLNKSQTPIVSVDIPSGLFPDTKTDNIETIRAFLTITFDSPKLAFMMPENENSVGDLKIVDIGLSLTRKTNLQSCFYYTTSANIIPKTRPTFGHKGTFGHGLLIAGSTGMMGAAILASKAAMRSGLGKLTTHIPKGNAQIMQITIPEVICQESEFEAYFNETWSKNPFENYTAIGIGPGIGTQNITGFEDFLKNLSLEKPLVLDADAINMLGLKPELKSYLPKNTILTPHQKEFKNLVGKYWDSDFEKIELLKNFAVEFGFIVCLKDHKTAVALPDGTVHFNSTGNSGMATAGSGDLLTGIILGFLAQGYTPHEAAIQGVYEHGAAGDRAAKKRSKRAMIASDIIENIL